ncbi:TPA: hypothetical protein ACQ31I_003463 [Yersinia enterocolitica]
MKKTLLSIMTMTILASGSANAAKNIDINVTADIPSKLNMAVPGAGAGLASARLIADPQDQSKYVYTETVTLTGNNGNQTVNVKVRSALQLLHEQNNTSLPVSTVKLGAKDIQVGTMPEALGQDFVLVGGKNDVQLDIVANTTPLTATGLYRGVLELELSETP